MKIEGAIFDLDGTLLDSMYIWDDVGERYLKERGILPENNIKSCLKTMSLMQSAEYFRQCYGIKDSAEKIISDITGIVDSFYRNEARIKEGVPEFLTLLKEKNIKMCIATATDRRLAEAALSRNHIAGFFEKIFTCNEAGSGKDSPEIFNLALGLLGTDKSKTLVFEDAAHAAKTANDAGFKVCGVFDKSESDTQILKENSYIYIKSFKEAVDYID